MGGINGIGSTPTTSSPSPTAPSATAPTNLAAAGSEQLRQIFNAQLGAYQQIQALPSDQQTQLLQYAQSQGIQDPADIITQQYINQMRGSQIYQQLAQQVQGDSPLQLMQMAIDPNISDEEKICLEGIAEDKAQNLNIFKTNFQQVLQNLQEDDPDLQQIQQDDDKQTQATDSSYVDSFGGDDS